MDDLPIEPTYDIDIECEKRGIGNPVETDDGMTQITCVLPKIFSIWCPTNTVQFIDDVYLCTTQDRKSVLISIQ
ncbi:MAG: hypothetical protein AAB855_01660 [Patescibacteria group bacterium]